MLSEHKNMCKKMASDFESKLNCVTHEKDNEIEKLHTQLAQLQQQNCCLNSESLLSFEKHETAISEKENEKEVNSYLLLS